MGKNDKHQTIIKRIFGANNGLQLQLLRQKLEVLEFQLSGVVPNEAQQIYIDDVNAEYEKYDNEINSYLGTVSLKDLEYEEMTK